MTTIKSEQNSNICLFHSSNAEIGLVRDFPHRNRVILQLRSAALTDRFTRKAEIAYPDGRHRVKIGDLEPGMFVRIICEVRGCDHLVEIDAEDFKKRGDPETELVHMAPGFRCEKCGHVGTRFWDAWRRTGQAS